MQQMPLKAGDLAVADEAYLRVDGTEVKELKYLEIVKVIKLPNKNGDILVEGFDSKKRALIDPAHLTPAQGQLPQDGIK